MTKPQLDQILSRWFLFKIFIIKLINLSFPLPHTFCLDLLLVGLISLIIFYKCVLYCFNVFWLYIAAAHQWCFLDQWVLLPAWTLNFLVDYNKVKIHPRLDSPDATACLHHCSNRWQSVLQRNFCEGNRMYNIFISVTIFKIKHFLLLRWCV